jgi:hypothetical protein
MRQRFVIRAMTGCGLLDFEQKDADIASDLSREELVGGRAVLAPDDTAERDLTFGALSQSNNRP